MKYLNKLNTGIQIIDHEMRYVFLNEALLKSLPLSLEEHLGKKMEDVYPDIDKSDIYQKIQECFRTGERQTVINEFLFEDGRLTYWELDIEKVENDVIIFSRDITETKTGEKLLKETNKKLEKLVEKRTKELTLANEKIKKIIGHVAHDLRTPIGNILSLAELSIMDTTNFEYIDSILKIASNCLEMIHTLLEEAAVKDGKIALHKETTNLANLIKEVVNNELNMAFLNKSRFELNLDHKFETFIDGKRISQVFSNLITNALKYSPTDSKVKITLAHDGLFTISNQIDYEKIKDAHDSENVRQSAGYGIEIVHSILTLHDLKLNTTSSKNYIQEIRF